MPLSIPWALFLTYTWWPTAWAVSYTHLDVYKRQAAERIADAAREAKAQVLGPVNASVYKVNDIYRKILYIKHTNYDILIRMKNDMEEYAAQTEPSKGLLVQYDFS